MFGPFGENNNLPLAVAAVAAARTDSNLVPCIAANCSADSQTVLDA